jgi:hypothetical protein
MNYWQSLMLLTEVMVTSFAADDGIPGSLLTYPNSTSMALKFHCTEI